MPFACSFCMLQGQQTSPSFEIHYSGRASYVCWVLSRSLIAQQRSARCCCGQMACPPVGVSGGPQLWSYHCANVHLDGRRERSLTLTSAVSYLRGHANYRGHAVRRLLRLCGHWSWSRRPAGCRWNHRYILQNYDLLWSDFWGLNTLTSSRRLVRGRRRILNSHECRSSQSNTALRILSFNDQDW